MVIGSESSVREARRGEEKEGEEERGVEEAGDERIHTEKVLRRQAGFGVALCSQGSQGRNASELAGVWKPGRVTAHSHTLCSDSWPPRL